MKRLLSVVCVVIAIGAAGAAGYWLGRHGQMATAPDLSAPIGSAAAEPQRRVLYYQHPDGLPDYSPAPKKDDKGRDYVVVYDDVDASPAPETSTPKGEGRILYYRNPMGLPDTSPVPKKDWMGMDYIPVREGDEADDPSFVKVNPERVQRLGVRTEPVVRRTLARTVRAVGSVQFDERRQSVLSTKFEGWIEKLHVNATGEPVKRGQRLMEIYSPELVQAQQEYLVAADTLNALHGANAEAQAVARRLLDGAVQRLRYLDVPPSEVERLRREGTATRRITVQAPADGVVIEKKAVEGMRIMAGEMLYRLVDLSSVWVIAEVFEQDLALVKPGQDASVTVNAYPGRRFPGRVSFVYPTLSAETRTARVRLEIPNPDGELRADMYASVELAAAMGGSTLVVPDSAVLDSGTRQVVLVDRGEGRFEPRPVRTGAKGDGYYEVLEGVAEDEKIVVSATFLIDAESNLRAALRAFAPEAQAPGAKP